MDNKHITRLIAAGIASLLLSTHAEAAFTCIQCPSVATLDGFSSGINITRTDGSVVSSAQTVQQCEQVIVHTDLAWRNTADQRFSGFVLHSADMYVNGVFVKSVAPPGSLDTIRVGPLSCADTEDLLFQDFPYTITAADSAAGIVNFEVRFSDFALRGLCDQLATGTIPQPLHVAPNPTCDIAPK